MRYGDPQRAPEGAMWAAEHFCRIKLKKNFATKFVVKKKKSILIHFTH